MSSNTSFEYRADGPQLVCNNQEDIASIICTSNGSWYPNPAEIIGQASASTECLKIMHCYRPICRETLQDQVNANAIAYLDNNTYKHQITSISILYIKLYVDS